MRAFFFLDRYKQPGGEGKEGKVKGGKKKEGGGKVARVGIFLSSHERKKKKRNKKEKRGFSSLDGFTEKGGEDKRGGKGKETGANTDANFLH